MEKIDFSSAKPIVGVGKKREASGRPGFLRSKNTSCLVVGLTLSIVILILLALALELKGKGCVNLDVASQRLNADLK
jgi:hypothetical protein